MAIQELPTANFGTRGFGTGSSSSSPPPASIPSALAQRMRDCEEAVTRLLSGETRVLVTAPWAGDRQTLPVQAAEGETGPELANRLAAGESLRDADSVTLLTATGIGGQVQQALSGRGFPLRVYEASTSLVIDPEFVIPEGGHWVVHGGLTATQELAVTYELIRAENAGFQYAESEPGSAMTVDDRAGLLRLLHTAVVSARQGLDLSPGVLDLAAVADVLRAAQRADLLWPGVMRSLRGQLGLVHTVVDLVREGTGGWELIDLPIETRRMFTATGPHALSDSRGSRTVDLSQPSRLLSGAATMRPEPADTLAVWLAESAVDHIASAKPLPMAGDVADPESLQRAVINQLRTLGVGTQDARGWADLMVHGSRNEDLAPQIVAAEDTEIAAIVDTYNAAEPVLSVPLGGGVLTVLNEVLANERAALDAGYDLAAHYLNHTPGETATRDTAIDMAKVASPVATLVEVVALGHLNLQAVLRPEQAPPVVARQPVSAVLAAAGPDLRGFLADHETHIRELFAATLRPVGATELWDTPVSVGADQHTVTLGEVLTDLLDPNRSPVTAVSGPASPAAATDKPWQLRTVELVVALDPRSDANELSAAARAAASLLTALDTRPESTEITQALATTANRAAALSNLRDSLNDILNQHPELADLAESAVRAVLHRDLSGWLAAALAALPPWRGLPDSAQRVATVLGDAQILPTTRLGWTAPALAGALEGEWRDTPGAALWDLPPGVVTLLWSQHTEDPERVLVVQRTDSGLALVDTQDPDGARVSYVKDRDGVGATVPGPVLVVVDTDNRIITLGPGASQGTVERLPLPEPVPSPEPGLTPANFGAAPVTEAPRVSIFHDEPTPAGAPRVVVVTVPDAVDGLGDYLTQLGPSRGFLVWSGDGSPSQPSPRDIARGFGLRALQPAPSAFADRPVAVRQTSDHLISPTGWLIDDPDGVAGYDDRGALSAIDLSILLGAPDAFGGSGDGRPVRVEATFDAGGMRLPDGWGGTVAGVAQAAAAGPVLLTVSADGQAHGALQVQQLLDRVVPPMKTALARQGLGRDNVAVRVVRRPVTTEPLNTVTLDAAAFTPAEGLTGQEVGLIRDVNDRLWQHNRPAEATDILAARNEVNVPGLSPTQLATKTADYLLSGVVGRLLGGYVGLEAELEMVLENAILDAVPYTTPKLAESANFVVVLDSRAVGGLTRPIIELVSKPYRILLDEEGFNDRQAVLGEFNREVARIQQVQPGTTLGQHFGAVGYQVEPGLQNYLIVGPGDPAKIGAQFTTGIPLAGIYDLLVFAERHSHANLWFAKGLSRKARQFSGEVVNLYAGAQVAGPDGELTWPLSNDLEIMTLRGFMASAYLHVLANAFAQAYRSHPFPGLNQVIVKNWLMAASRVSLSAMRVHLPDQIKEWLVHNARDLRQILHERTVVDPWMSNWVNQENLYSVLDFEVRTNWPNRPDFTLHQLFDNALLPPHPINQSIDQFRAFSIRTNLPDLDLRANPAGPDLRAGNLPVAPQELRHFGLPDIGLRLTDINEVMDLLRAVEHESDRIDRMAGGLFRPIVTPFRLQYHPRQTRVDQEQNRQISELARRFVNEAIRDVAAGRARGRVVTVVGSPDSFPIVAAVVDGMTRYAYEEMNTLRGALPDLGTRFLIPNGDVVAFQARQGVTQAVDGRPTIEMTILPVRTPGAFPPHQFWPAGGAGLALSQHGLLGGGSGDLVSVPGREVGSGGVPAVERSVVGSDGDVVVGFTEEGMSFPVGRDERAGLLAGVLEGVESGATELVFTADGRREGAGQAQELIDAVVPVVKAVLPGDVARVVTVHVERFDEALAPTDAVRVRAAVPPSVSAPLDERGEALVFEVNSLIAKQGLNRPAAAARILAASEVPGVRNPGEVDRAVASKVVGLLLAGERGVGGSRSAVGGPGVGILRTGAVGLQGGAIGFEAETDAVLDISYADPSRPDSEQPPKPRRIASSRLFEVHVDGRENEHIIELVSKPFNVLDGETGFADFTDVMRDFKTQLGNLERINSGAAGIPVAQFYSPANGFTLDNELAGMNVSIVKPHVPDKIYMQYTAGVPLAGIYDLMKFAEKYTDAPWAGDHAAESRAFGRRVTYQYLGLADPGLEDDPHGEFLGDLEAMSLLGFMSSVYAHVVAPIKEFSRSADPEIEDTLPKNWLLAASRVPFSVMREALPPGPRAWLRANADFVRTLVNQHAIESDDAIRDWLAENRAASLLDAFISNAQSQHFAVRKYLDNALLPIEEVALGIDQKMALGIRTNIYEMQAPVGGLPLAPQELRGFGSYVDFDQAQNNLRAIAQEVRQIDSKARNLPRRIAIDDYQVTLGSGDVARIVASAEPFFRSALEDWQAGHQVRTIVRIGGRTDHYQVLEGARAGLRQQFDLQLRSAQQNAAAAGRRAVPQPNIEIQALPGAAGGWAGETASFITMTVERLPLPAGAPGLVLSQYGLLGGGQGVRVPDAGGVPGVERSALGGPSADILRTGAVDLLSEVIGDPEPVVPESVGLMSRMLGPAANGASADVSPMRLAERRFPAGLRLQPNLESEMTQTADWVGARLDDPTLPGAHRPGSWKAFRALVERAGEEGMVLSMGEVGRGPVVYMKSGDDIWRLAAGEAERWTEPPALPGVADPPRMVLAFNKCADFVP